jgi:hypothetical protein
MKSYIRCGIYPGQFSSEYAVSSKDSRKRVFSLFAPTDCVLLDGEQPTRDRTVDGWLIVEVLESDCERALVRLPRESFELGRFVTVSVSLLKDAPEPIGA